jgi:formate C-acetyltransferase
MAFLAHEYVKTMNAIHYIHDKYYYERAQMSLLDTDLKRVMGFGLAGLSVVADSLSAIKYAKVKTLRNDKGLTTGFITTGEYPKYGNDDDRVDLLAKITVDKFFKELCKYQIYRGAEPTISVLTITSNVVYGKNTGATPDGRLAGVPFAPGANPMPGREENGAISAMNSVAKIDYKSAKDGISYTFSIVPQTLGKDLTTQKSNLVDLLDGYFAHNAQHMNVNVLNREVLQDAMANPDKYPNLTIRVSGYAVMFNRLTKEQQEEVVARTFFDKI